MNYSEVIANAKTQDIRFQPHLAKFLINEMFKNKIDVFVETGSGLSTAYLLQAVDGICDMKLYSIDPEPFCEYEIKHPRYELIRKKSFQALADLYIKTGAWDFFLHDSDHWIECQTYEYELAYQCLKPGGYIFSDDYDWDNQGVWKRFIEKYNLEIIKVGDIQGAQKTMNEIIDPEYVKSYSKKLWEDTKVYGKKWREDNGRKPCWTCSEELTEYWKFPEK